MSDNAVVQDSSIKLGLPQHNVVVQDSSIKLGSSQLNLSLDHFHQSISEHVKILQRNHTNFKSYFNSIPKEKLDETKYHLLCSAAFMGYKGDIKKLIKMNAIYYFNDFIGSPLHYAIINNHIDVCKMLLSFFPSIVDFNHSNDNYDRPIILAIKLNNYNIVKLLLDAGAAIHFFDSKLKNKYSSIIDEIYNGYTDRAVKDIVIKNMI